jgi:hypothetical protein
MLTAAGADRARYGSLGVSGDVINVCEMELLSL